MSRETVDFLAAFFLRAFLLCAAMQLFAVGLLTLGHDWAFSLHAKLFGISVETFDTAAYYLIGLMKIFNLTFFLTPWVVLQSLRSKSN